MQQSCPVFFDHGDQVETCAQLFYFLTLSRDCMDITLAFTEYFEKLMVYAKTIGKKI
jgi:hypothetical protein|nr:MAG TPA: hypothetical protein [Bacteriophage sp.]